MSAPEPRYFILWKGRQTGPFSVEQIRLQLGAGEISRMHQIGNAQKWESLDEFLTRDAQEAESGRAVEAARREAKLRNEYEVKLEAERARHAELEARLAEREKHSPLLPPQLPPPLQSAQTAQPPIHASADNPPGPMSAPFRQTRTSGLAIAALVMGLCNFIPGVWFVSWILALVFGHIALSQIKRDPSLEGRGMAIAGVVITYVLLGLGIVIGIAYVASTRR